MKKIIFVLLGAMFVGGCSLSQDKEPVSVVMHDTATIDLTTKTPYDHQIQIVDPRDNKVIEVIDPDEYDPDMLKEKAVTLASDLATTIDRPMKPYKLGGNGELTAGQSKMILHEDELVNLITDVSFFNKQVVLPITETPPNVTEEVIKGIDEIVLGSYTTYFDPSQKGRVFNIAKSANEINNTVLGPGDKFYFNTVVGNASKENGYQLATVIVNKEFVPGYGGGICQTSSTLYNAVAEAGLEIIELHHHSRSIGYVPKGKDATVAYPYLDFKFANNRPYPVLLKTVVDEEEGSIEFKVLSAANYVSN